MTDIRLYTKISSLPNSLKSEVVDFIDFIQRKKNKQSKSNKKTRTFGYAKDTIVLRPDFDDPLEDFKEYI